MTAADAPTTMARVLLGRARDPTTRHRPAVMFGDQIWSHAEYHAECCRWADLFLERLPAGAPPHVGVLLDNTPDYTFALGGAALAGAVIVGLNPTHRGDFLLGDLAHTDVALVVTEPRHLPLLAEISGRHDAPLLVSHRFAGGDGDGGAPAGGRGEDLDEALEDRATTPPAVAVEPEDVFTLIFTSGTSGHPKAVIYTQSRVASGSLGMAQLLGMTEVDVAYMAMPLFHSQSLYVNWGPVMATGAATALARRFSASRWLSDIRRYGATVTNYTGTPLGYLLAQPERDDDADNPLRVAYGNEGSTARVDAFSSRFGVHVIEVYGATEGTWGIYRDDRTPPGALGPLPDDALVVDESGQECPRARFDADGALLNAPDCIGEMVGTASAESFPGYYKAPEATAEATRGGWVWTGDLAYVDEAGYAYFAGRTSERIRVGAENFAATPIEAVLTDHPAVTAAAVFGVPDAEAGDQVMAALVVRDDADLDDLAGWIQRHPSLSPTWRPSYVRLMTALPMTASHKVLKRQLAHEKYRLDRVADDPVFVRHPETGRLTPFDEAAEAGLRAAFRSADRMRFWEG